MESTIVNSLEANRCVLILGPDLYVKEINGKPLERKQFFSDLEKQINSCIYFPNEDVFEIEQKDSWDLKGKINTFYSNGGDYSLMELISSIKFPLILNASPDNSLY